jgi:PhnB protein
MQAFGDETQKSPPGGVAPHICCAGAMDAIQFYKHAFGAEEVFRTMHEDGKRVMYCHLRTNGGSFMIHDDFPEFRDGADAPEPQGVIIHLQVDNADTWWDRAVAAGAQASMPLQDQPWGDRYGHLKDRWGHIWSLASPVGKNR